MKIHLDNDDLLGCFGAIAEPLLDVAGEVVGFLVSLLPFWCGLAVTVFLISAVILAVVYP